MSYRFIALDLDGTVLSPDGRVTERTRAAVLSLVEKGTTVCFATGRNWKESRPVFEKIGHLDWAVIVGGAVVIDAATRRIIHRRCMDSALAVEVCTVLESRGMAVMALQDHEKSAVDYIISGELNAGTKLWLELTRTEAKRVATLTSGAHEHTLRITTIAEPAATAAALEKLTEHFGSRIVFHCIAVPKNSVEVLEVFDPRVNKWAALLQVAAHKGIDRAEIIAVGDDLNDLPMLQNAGLGVAMGNAHPKAKAAAKRTIGSNAEDGLAVFLEELHAGSRL